MPRRSCTAAWQHADAAGRGHTREVVRAGALAQNSSKYPTLN
jgi:hypothetical protein